MLDETYEHLKFDRFTKDGVTIWSDPKVPPVEAFERSTPLSQEYLNSLDQVNKWMMDAIKRKYALKSMRPSDKKKKNKDTSFFGIPDMGDESDHYQKEKGRGD